jgi:hypothetical protein
MGDVQPRRPAGLEEAFGHERAFLWGLCYCLTGNAADAERIEPRLLNGLPAIVVDLGATAVGWAPLMVVQCSVDARGRITALYSVLASRKLAGLAPSRPVG